MGWWGASGQHLFHFAFLYNGVNTYRKEFAPIRIYFFALRLDLFGIAKIHGGVLPIHLKGVYCDSFQIFLFIYKEEFCA